MTIDRHRRAPRRGPLPDFALVPRLRERHDGCAPCIGGIVSVLAAMEFVTSLSERLAKSAT